MHRRPDTLLISTADYQNTDSGGIGKRHSRSRNWCCGSRCLQRLVGSFEDKYVFVILFENFGSVIHVINPFAHGAENFRPLVMMDRLAGRLQAPDWHACCRGSWERRLAALLVRLAPMPSRRRATRIVELVELAGAADAAYGCSALLDREKATVGASAAGGVRILGAPFVWIVWHPVGAGGQQRYQQQECC